MKLSAADVVPAYVPGVSNGPVLLPEGFWCVTYRLSGTLDRLRKLDMAQHCKRIAYGGGKGCMRMRRSCTCPFLGTLSVAGTFSFRVTGFYTST